MSIHLIVHGEIIFVNMLLFIYEHSCFFYHWNRVSRNADRYKNINTEGIREKLVDSSGHFKVNMIPLLSYKLNKRIPMICEKNSSNQQ